MQETKEFVWKCKLGVADVLPPSSDVKPKGNNAMWKLFHYTLTSTGQECLMSAT